MSLCSSNFPPTSARILFSTSPKLSVSLTTKRFITTLSFDDQGAFSKTIYSFQRHQTLKGIVSLRYDSVEKPLFSMLEGFIPKMPPIGKFIYVPFHQRLESLGHMPFIFIYVSPFRFYRFFKLKRKNPHITGTPLTNHRNGNHINNLRMSRRTPSFIVIYYRWILLFLIIYHCCPDVLIETYCNLNQMKEPTPLIPE